MSTKHDIVKRINDQIESEDGGDFVELIQLLEESRDEILRLRDTALLTSNSN